jgi:hypothetical protein
MKSFNQLARAAYAAFVQRAGGKTYDGKTLAGWTEIGVEQQACWIEAVKEVAAQLQAIH